MDGVIAITTKAGNKTMIITNELLYNELQEVKQLLNKLLTNQVEGDIKEISLNKVCQLLHRGAEFVKSEADNGNLKAKTYKSKGVKRYRFLLKDVREYLSTERQAPEVEIETIENLTNKYFPHKKAS